MDNSGPAFPIPDELHSKQDVHEFGHPGLTKREWLAGMALQGLCANPVMCATPSLRDCAHVRDLALELADALLAAQKEQSK